MNEFEDLNLKICHCHEFILVGILLFKMLSILYGLIAHYDFEMIDFPCDFCNVLRVK